MIFLCCRISCFEIFFPRTAFCSVPQVVTKKISCCQTWWRSLIHTCLISQFRENVIGFNFLANTLILWLNICPSNNDLAIISYFYISCISNLKCVPKTIRGDRGSENVVVAGMQWHFRGKHQDFMSGHSIFYQKLIK